MPSLAGEWPIFALFAKVGFFCGYHRSSHAAFGESTHWIDLAGYPILAHVARVGSFSTDIALSTAELHESIH